MSGGLVIHREFGAVHFEHVAAASLEVVEPEPAGPGSADSAEPELVELGPVLFVVAGSVKRFVHWNSV